MAIDAADRLLTPGGAVTDVEALLPVVENQPWSAVGISSVAGERHIRQWLRRWVSGKQALRVAVSESSSMGVRNSYAVPGEMGVDRWLAMLAAHACTRGRLCDRRRYRHHLGLAHR